VGVQQLGHAIQARRVLEFGKVEDEVRPLFAWRKMVPREGVDVGREA
jgi:hypothetical protein